MNSLTGDVKGLKIAVPKEYLGEGVGEEARNSVLEALKVLVIGRAFYMDDQLQSLNIDIPIQFYGNSEAIGFTQYVAGLVMERFPKYIAVQVSITSVNGPEALIVREANQDEPTVHIYE